MGDLFFSCIGFIYCA